MRILTTLLAAAALTASTALAYDFSALQQAVMANPAVQQQVVGAVAANPQLATGAAGSMGGMASMLSNLTPEQASQLSAQVKTITDKLFTKAEQTKLEQFQATPEGASIVSKLPELAQQLAPVLLQMYMSQPGSAALAPSAAAPLKLTPAGK